MSEKSSLYIQIGQGIGGLGDGVWFSIWVVYFTEVVGIETSTIVLVIGAAGIAGIFIAYGCGAASDKFSSRDVLVCLYIVRGFAMIGAFFVDSLLVFFLVAFALFGTQSAVAGVKTSLIYNIFDERDQQLEVLALNRVVQHVAYAVGAGLGGIVLATDSGRTFRSALIFNALSFFLMAALTSWIPWHKRVMDSVSSRFGSALLNYPYCFVMAVTAVFALSWSVMSTGAPLWVRDYTNAPKWFSALLVVINSAGIALFQLPVTRRVITINSGCYAAVFAGVFLAISCVLFAVSSWGNELLAIILLLLATALLVVGELYFIASRWVLSIGLMDANEPGRYQGLAAAFQASVAAFGPAIVSLVVILPSLVGWVLLSVLFAGAGIVTPSLVRWAQQRG